MAKKMLTKTKLASFDQHSTIKFGPKWTRAFLKRNNWTYKKVLGKKVVVDEQVIDKANKETSTIIVSFEPSDTLNFDESSVCIRHIGEPDNFCLSYKKI